MVSSLTDDEINNDINLSYLNKYLKVNDILISINNNFIDSHGFIKFNFYVIRKEL